MSAREGFAARACSEHARALATSLVAAAAIAAAARAEEPPDTIVRDVPPVVVQDVRPENLREDPTAFSSVVDLEAYAGEAKSVEDLLSQVPGVQIRRFGGPGQPSEISIRGSTASQVVVLLDGVRIDSAQTGTVDLSTIPVDLLEKIEVTRGGGGVEQGSGAIGGVVNFVTKRPSAEPRTVLVGSLASFGTGEGSALHARRIGAYELTAAYQAFTTRGDFEFQRPVTRFAGVTIVPDPPTLTRINNEALIQSGLFRLGRDLGEGFHVSLQDSLTHSSRGAPGLDSGAGAFGGQQPFAHQRFTRNVADLSLEGADVAGLGLDVDADLYHRFQRIQFRNPEPTFGPPIDTAQDNQTIGGRLRGEKAFTLVDTEHRTMLGFELFDDRLEATAFANPTRATFDTTMQDEISLFDRIVVLVPGVRIDLTEGFGERAVPRIGALVTPFDWLRLKANFERAYRVPSFDELYYPDEGFLRGNPGLAPEEAWTYDAGAAIELPGSGILDRITIEAAYFDQDIENSIVWVLVSPFTVAPINTGAATARGVEASASVALLRWFEARASYTHLDAFFDSNGAPLTGRSPNELSGRVTVGPPSGLFRIFADALYTDVIPVSESGNTILPARTTYDVGVVVDVVQIPWLGSKLPMRRLLVSFEASNLTDVSVRDAQFFPQPGRVLSVKAEATF